MLVHRHKHRKSTLPISHKKTHCAMITCLATQGPFAVTTKPIISPYSGFCGFAIFSQMPTLLFVEMLPGWHKLKYVCVDVCVGVSVCGSARLCVFVCVCVWWVGGCLCGMEEWITQTGQSGGRLVSGPYSYYQAGCSIRQLTESLQSPSLHSPT